MNAHEAQVLLRLRAMVGDETVTKDEALRYVQDALDHRTRVSGWLAELDDALGFTGQLTQDGGKAGANAQGARLQRAREVRHASSAWIPRAECRPRIPVVVYSPHDREEVRLELHGVPRVGEELELQEGRWLVDLVVWFPDHVEIRTRNAT